MPAAQPYWTSKRPKRWPKVLPRRLAADPLRKGSGKNHPFRKDLPPKQRKKRPALVHVRPEPLRAITRKHVAQLRQALPRPMLINKSCEPVTSAPRAAMARHVKNEHTGGADLAQRDAFNPRIRLSDGLGNLPQLPPPAVSHRSSIGEETAKRELPPRLRTIWASSLG